MENHRTVVRRQENRYQAGKTTDVSLVLEVGPHHTALPRPLYRWRWAFAHPARVSTHLLGIVCGASTPISTSWVTGIEDREAHFSQAPGPQSSTYTAWKRTRHARFGRQSPLLCLWQPERMRGFRQM